jgi:hypothetical protein
MTVSWFGGGIGSGATADGSCTNTKVSMKEAAQALYPHKRWDAKGQTRTRFSSLLLEHTEKHIQDWAVIAYSSPSKAAPPTPRKSATTQWSQQQQQMKNSSTTTSTSTSSPQNQKKKKRHKKTSINPLSTKESHPTVHMTKWEGRLHLCSKSLVFEPNDASRGIVRCPFSRMAGPPTEYPSNNDPSIQQTGSFDPTCVEYESSRHFVMKANHSIGPFDVVPVTTTFRLTFLHSSPFCLTEVCHQLFAAIREKANSKNHPIHLKDELETALLQPMYDRPFDPTNLLDVRERPLTSHLKCHLLQPLQSQPGCVVLTQERLYFQPAAGGVSAAGAGESSGGLEKEHTVPTTQATSWLLQHGRLVATARRYKGLEDAALELYWKDGTSSTLLAFDRKHEREQVLRLLPPHIPCHTDREFLLQASHEWQKGSISNFDYLLLLNSAAGRTMQDLSRYPVFPWVIADYESPKLDLTKEATFRDLTKPIGALNAERLEYFRQRYESMHDAVAEPFLYGTHYSAAGYVLYYLARSMPEHMLCLQNGKRDYMRNCLLLHNIAHIAFPMRVCFGTIVHMLIVAFIPAARLFRKIRCPRSHVPQHFPLFQLCFKQSYRSQGVDSRILQSKPRL